MHAPSIDNTTNNSTATAVNIAVSTLFKQKTNKQTNKNKQTKKTKTDEEFQNCCNMGTKTAGCLCGCTALLFGALFELYANAKARVAVERKLGRSVYQQRQPSQSNLSLWCTLCFCGPCSHCQQAKAIRFYELAKANGKVNDAWEDQPRSSSNSVSVGPIPGIGTQPKTTRALPMPAQPYDGSGAEQGVNPPDYASIADIPAGQAPYFRGNIDRKTAQNELRNKPVGSFLIREKGGSDNLIISTVVRAAQNSNSAQYRHDVIVVESNGGVDSVYGQVVNESIGQQFKIDGKVVGNPPASTLAEVVQYLSSDASWLGVQLTTENTMDDYEWPTGSPGIGQGLGGRLSVNNW